MLGKNLSSSAVKEKFNDAFSVFSFADYRLYWQGWLSYQFAQQVFSYTTIQWFYHLSRSEFSLGKLSLLIVIICLPSILLGGILGDRFNRKSFILINLCSMLMIYGLVCIDILTGQMQNWHVYVFYTLINVFALFGISAWSGLLNRVVPKEKMNAAVAINVMTIYFISGLSPLVFMLSYYYIGPLMCYLLCALGTIFSGICFMRIKAMGAVAREVKQESPLKMLTHGFSFINAHPVILGLFLLDIGVTIVSYYRDLFPIIAMHLYHGSVFSVGILGFANALGGVLGALIMLWLKNYKAKGRLSLIATLIYALILLPFGLIHIFAVGLITVILLSLTDTISMTIRQSIVQVSAPDYLLSRAQSFRTLAAVGANFIGQTELASFSGVMGASNTILLGGVVSIIIVLIIWKVFPAIYRYQDHS